MRLLSVAAVLVSLFLSSCGLTNRVIKTTFPDMSKVPAQLPRLSQPLALDGELKEWDSAISMPVRAKSFLLRSEKTPPASKLKSGMEVLAAWNDMGLCISFMVVDPNVVFDLSKSPDNQDSIQIQLDERTGEKYLSPEFTDGAFLIIVRPPLPEHAPEASLWYGKMEGLKVGGRSTPRGYNLEVLIPWSALPNAKSQVGSRLGLQFVLNENESDDSRSRALWYLQPDAKFRGDKSRFIEFELAQDMTLDSHSNLVPMITVEAPDKISTQIMKPIRVEAGRSISNRISAFKFILADSKRNLWKKTMPAIRESEPWHDSVGATLPFPKIGKPVGDCRLIVIPTDAKGKALGRAERVIVKEDDQRSEQLRNLSIKPENDWDRILQPGSFPRIVWTDSSLAQDIFGEKYPQVRWFNANLEEVEQSEEPGRYAAYIEAKTKDGRTVRRAVSFYVNDSDWEPWNAKVEVNVLDSMFPGAQAGALVPYRKTIDRWASDALVSSLSRDEMGPIMFAAFQDAKPLGHPLTQFDLPETQNLEFLMAVRNKALGGTRQFATLEMPRKATGGPAMMIHKGTLAEAGMKANTPEEIRKIATEWTQAAGVPNTIMIVRHGVEVFHEAFGSVDKTSTTLDAKFGTASITKLHAGLLLAQFIDQGIISLDDPVGRFLPDFPTTGAKVLTVRECMNHTSGLEGHGNWGGIYNPFLDNVIACSPECLKPGEVVQYNGMGIDLTGKVMEAASGKSIFRLMQESFFMPLGQDNPVFCDLGYGLECTSEDLARVGQLMMNKGAYGDTVFFSPETFKKVAPIPLKDLNPALKDSDWVYGAGITTMNEYRPDSGKSGTISSKGEPIPQEKQVLSKETIGHGSASGCILRVDPVNDIVITMVRQESGTSYDKYVSLFMQTVVDCIEK